MVPTFDQYITASIRALSEVVLPAIDKSDSMALEQAQLVIGMLTLMADQWDKALQLEMTELRAHLRLADVLATAADGGSATREARARCRATSAGVAGLAAVDIPAHGTVHAANVALRASLTDLLAAGRRDGTPAFSSQATAAVLAHAAEQNLLARSWFAKSRLDADWSGLPPIAQVLAGYTQPGTD